MRAFGFEVADIELLKVELEVEVCDDTLLAFFTAAASLVCGGSESWRVEESAEFVKGIRCDSVPTLMATG